MLTTMHSTTYSPRGTTKGPKTSERPSSAQNDTSGDSRGSRSTSQSTSIARTSTSRISPSTPRPSDLPPRKNAWNSSTSLHSKRSAKPSGTASSNDSLSGRKPPSGRSPVKKSTSGIFSTTTASPSSKSSTSHYTKQQYEKILGGQYKTDSAMRNALHSLRTLVLKKGIQEDYEDNSARPRGRTICSLRGRIWKVLLGIYRVSSSEYLGLIDRGPSDVYEKIRNDTFRTLATDKKFLAIVDEEMLSRLLNAFVWKMKDLPRSRLLNYCFTYVQGMNVMVAPFLYVMPELDAFYTFSAFLQSSCPLYVQPALEGVHCGLKLVDRCLRLCDPSLHRYLLSKKLNATLYAFPAVMTFSACTPPLEEVIQLWDFFVAYGFHLNVLCVTGQIILMRDQLLSHESPMRLLRKFPPLDAKKLIKIARSLVFKLPEDIYDLLARHPFDAGVYDIIMGLDDQRINSQEIWMGD